MSRPTFRSAADELARRDPTMAKLVAAFGPCRPGSKPAPAARFETLAVAIVSQQLATKAADAIWGRVVEAVGAPITPAAVLATDPVRLRAAGLSQAKAVSMLDLATRVETGALDLASLGRRSDTDVTDALVAVKGIGPWTADMFMIFGLHRLDIWPIGDLGVRNGFARAFGLGAVPSAAELLPLADHLKPYRSVVAWYCWRAAEAKW